MRRFKTKLISMAMMGYDRVIVEPSGVYDVDEFFDTLREEPLDRWYEPGNVIAVVSAAADPDLSDESAYLLASQIANAGCVILSKVQCVSGGKVREMSELLNGIMEKFHCRRRFSDDLIAVDWNDKDRLDLAGITKCGYRLEDHIKYQVEKDNHFSSLFYFYVSMDENGIRSAVESIFDDPGCGRVHRIKGFVKLGENKWIRINADALNKEFLLTDSGREAVIVIGEDLNRDAVDKYLSASSKYSGELDH
jgi:G3E family GTPase